MTPQELAEAGWHLVPWTNRQATTRQPIVKGYLENHPTPETVAGWMVRYTACDWAVVPKQHVVLDIEMKNGQDGEKSLLALSSDSLAAYPQTKTFNGGRHVWMQVPQGCELKGGVWIGEGLEVKRNASVHIPPSAGYAWLRPLGLPDDIPVAPDWFMEA